jgi:phosphoglycerate dehydrogenase-like enzyme
MKTRVLVWSRIPNFQQTLQQYAAKRNTYPVQFDMIESHETLLKSLNDIVQPEILIADPPQIPRETWQFLLQKKPIKWIQSTWAGVESAFRTIHSLNLNSDSLFGVTLTKKGGFGPHMVEYALQHMLNYERQYNRLQAAQKRSEWDDNNYKYRTLRECTVGIMGFGDIGEHVAQVLKQSFSMRVHVLRKKESTPNEIVDRFFSTDNNGVEQFLASGVDYIINTMPSTKETRGLLNQHILQHCRSSPCFINVGRGDLISEKDLLHALDQGHFSHVVLDVFEQEPLPKESKLWNHDKVVITPHVSAKSFPEETAAVFYENLELYKKNLPLKYVADWNGGY